jgi:hypothetical protein
MKKRTISAFLKETLLWGLRPLVWAWLWLLRLILKDKDKRDFP